jgi:hypothetical protein
MLHRTKNMHFFLKVCNVRDLGRFEFLPQRASGYLKVRTLKVKLMHDEHEQSSFRYKAPLQWAPKDKMTVFSRTAHMVSIKFYSFMVIIKGKEQGKAIPVTGRGGP